MIRSCTPAASEKVAPPARAVTPPVTVRETHSAYVFFIGDIAYKMKKAIKTDFLDFTSLDSRWWACEREFTLNSRFSGDVYLGIAELPDPTGGPAEPLLKMRRLPDATRLATSAAAGRDLEGKLGAIAQAVAAVHVRSVRTFDIDRQGTRDALARRWNANISELRTLADGLIGRHDIDELERLVDRYLAGRAALFDARIADGRIVDGHGDLLADDIFLLSDGPRILDCLDFDDHLRYVDGIDDAACLAMDLEFHGRPDAASAFLDAYREAAADSPPTSLTDHYVAYRAIVRAKVACIRFRQGSAPSHEDAVEHMRLALEHLKGAAVKLVLVGGLPGSGKTTLATALAQATGAAVISSDVVRKELAGLDPSGPRPARVGEGLYTPSITDQTYAELLQRARTYLCDGRSVLIDASWSDPPTRERAELLAASTFSDLLQFECVAPKRVSIDRIATRRPSASDATRDVYEAMADHQTPWPDAHRIDTAVPVAKSTAAALAVLRNRREVAPAVVTGR
ncbi:AAA family ATPase [Rhodococcus sp. G-MC3]|uniref:bifunctional aminoglycoside phosphotransferase/ATP-binding protein n=1 Tax=Rhodococcus sp. G-MC3 TaxID=3046209 RepID=UPI0024BB6685|nr:bifunctional aminoglycoside phosphotransferase/ATP-binding protein [Rhodococcus sp. G-MC3]MDJ0396482.1 AAA family ATPase [Rhodococcus sp. G-MC3]